MIGLQNLLVASKLVNFYVQSYYGSPNLTAQSTKCFSYYPLLSILTAQQF